MKDIKIVIDKKEYCNKPLTVGDWLLSVEFAEKYADKNVLIDRAAGLAAMDLLAEHLGAPAEEMKKKCALTDIMQAWREYRENIVEAFVGTPAVKNAEGRKRPEK